MVTKQIKPMASGGNSNPQTPTLAIINSIASTSASNTKKCPHISSEAKTILETWCSNYPHKGIVGCPIPEETDELIQQTGLEKDQLDQWFFQWRKKQQHIMPKKYGNGINPSKYRGIKYSKKIGKYVVQMFHKMCYKFIGEFDLAFHAAWANEKMMSAQNAVMDLLSDRNQFHFLWESLQLLKSNYPPMFFPFHGKWKIVLGLMS